MRFGTAAGQRGQAMVEWIGVLSIVVVIVAVVIASPLPARAAQAIRCDVSKVLGSHAHCGDGGQSAPGGGSAAGPGGSTGGGSSTGAGGAGTSTGTSGGATEPGAVTDRASTGGATTPAACPTGQVQAAPPAAIGVCVPIPPCPAGQTRAEGPVLRGQTLPCVSNGNAPTTPSLPKLPPYQKPVPPKPGEEVRADGDLNSCGPGWNFHYSGGTGYCAWAPADPNPGKLGETPGAVVEHAAEGRGVCLVDQDGLAKKDLNKPIPPSMGPAVKKDPTAVLVDPGTPNAHYELFPYGKSEYQLYTQILGKLWDTVKGIPMGQQKRDEISLQIEELAMAKAQTESSATAPPLPAGGSGGEGDGGEGGGGEGEEPDPEPPIMEEGE